MIKMASESITSLLYCRYSAFSNRGDTRKDGYVYLPDEVRLASPSPQSKAQQFASEVLRLEIVNDPQFKSGCYWEFESMEVDLANYGTPNLESSDGSKAWRGG
jgi:hypothetical protein